jgi:hypothetical protein
MHGHLGTHPNPSRATLRLIDDFRFETCQGGSGHQGGHGETGSREGSKASLP